MGGLPRESLSIGGSNYLTTCARGGSCVLRQGCFDPTSQSLSLSTARFGGGGDSVGTGGRRQDIHASSKRLMFGHARVTEAVWYSKRGFFGPKARSLASSTVKYSTAYERPSRVDCTGT